MISENQSQMILLFLGWFTYGKIGPTIWALQWFMLYHEMITNEKAKQKARWGRNLGIFAIFMGLL